MSKMFIDFINKMNESTVKHKEIWVLMPNALLSGKILSLGATEAAIQSFMQNSNEEKRKGGNDGEYKTSNDLVTLVEVVILSGEIQIDAPFAFVIPDQVIAWGPGLSMKVS